MSHSPHSPQSPQSSHQPRSFVFISYAHEGNLSEQVKQLAHWLAQKLEPHGVEVVTDHPFDVRAPKKGWRAWMEHNVDNAAVVLMVCSERYKALFEKREIPHGGGRGATWESAVITSDLYQARLVNEKFYPILPDGGSHEHVPNLLTDWHNGHFFPSGNERILQLVEQTLADQPVQQGRGKPADSGAHTAATVASEPVSEAISEPLSTSMSRELIGAHDPLLQPRETKVFGREEEIAQVLAFLTSLEGSAAVFGNLSGSHSGSLSNSLLNNQTSGVTGTGGIGKTEVCKAALKQWLALAAENAPVNTAMATKAFWVQVHESATSQTLLTQLGEAAGLATESLAQITQVAQLAPHLPKGLYYLDNLESVADAADGASCLRELSQIPGIHLLASSRVALDGVFQQSIVLERLATEHAVALFKACWNGKTLPLEPEIAEFVDKQLGGHGLSITLMARLGKFFSWEKLLQRWEKLGTALATAGKSQAKLDSLEVCFALTAERLADTPGALDLWQFVALFPEGVDDETLSLWEEIAEDAFSARHALIEHHLLSAQENAQQLTFTMLPPIARYGLKPAHLAATGGFNWPRARSLAYVYFICISQHASDTASSEQQIAAQSLAAAQLWAVANLLQCEGQLVSPEASISAGTDTNSGEQALAPESELSAVLINQLRNVFAFNPLAGRAVLQHAQNIVERFNTDLLGALGHGEVTGLINFSLGALEARLGNVEAAQEGFTRAIALFEQVQNKLGLANALHGLGQLETKLGNIKAARESFARAKELYEQVQEKLGLANSLLELGELEKHLGNLEAAREGFTKAMSLYEQVQDKLGLANALHRLGVLERRLGNVEAAREGLIRAIGLYEEVQNKLGIANSLRRMGDTYLVQDEAVQIDIAQAQHYYQQALPLYIENQDPAGQAHTLAELIRCEKHLQQCSPEAFTQLASAAFIAAQRSGVESVTQYVMAALFEYFDEDQAKFLAFGEKLFV